MGQILSFESMRDWVIEGSSWRPPGTIVLKDEAGLPIPVTSLASLLLTLYDLSGGAFAIVNGVERVDVKNARGSTVNAQGVFVLTLQPADTVILDPSRLYERRRALVEYEWPLTPTKADALELTLVIRNVHRRPYVAP